MVAIGRTAEFPTIECSLTGSGSTAKAQIAPGARERGRRPLPCALPVGRW